MVSGTSAPETSPTLIGRLRSVPLDQEAWQDFVGIYGAHIMYWARERGLQAADAEDVTQATLLRIAKAMRDFNYDPELSFRGWLRTLARHACYDLARVRRPLMVGIDRLLTDPNLCYELANALESAFDDELLQKAMASVRLRVEPSTWEAFRLTALEQLSGAEAAKRLGVRLTTIYKSRSNVQKMLQEEVRFFESEYNVDFVPS